MIMNEDNSIDLSKVSIRFEDTERYRNIFRIQDEVDLFTYLPPHYRRYILANSENPFALVHNLYWLAVRMNSSILVILEHYRLGRYYKANLTGEEVYTLLNIDAFVDLALHYKPVHIGELVFTLDEYYELLKAYHTLKHYAISRHIVNGEISMPISEAGVNSRPKGTKNIDNEERIPFNPKYMKHRYFKDNKTYYFSNGYSYLTASLYGNDLIFNTYNWKGIEKQEGIVSWGDDAYELDIGKDFCARTAKKAIESIKAKSSAGK